MTMSSSTAKKAAPKKKAPADRKPSLRDMLASKKPRVTEATFPIGEQGERAHAELDQARQSLELLKFATAKQQAQGAKTTVDLGGAEKRVKDAEAAYERASMTLRFRGITPVEVDALRSEFTSSDDEEDAAKFDVRGYTCALLAMCVLDSDLTAEEWDEELYESGRWSEGEIAHIRDMAREAYLEVAAPGVPKG